MNEEFLKCLKARSTCLRNACFVFGEGRNKDESRYLIDMVSSLTLLLDNWLEELLNPKSPEGAKEPTPYQAILDMVSAKERKEIIDLLYEMRNQAAYDCDYERACAFRDAAKRIALRGGLDEVEKDKFR